jgi:DNA adenine methylase
MTAVAPLPPETSARPFVKWVGGKRQLVPELLAKAPPRFGRYFEPFVGGGALFFALRPVLATLADANDRLARTYRAIRNDADAVIALLSTYRYESAFYYEMRALDIDARTDAEVAAWFIYVNRCGFNGLYRVNQAGSFNVPFGRHTNPTICDAENIRACQRALHGVTIRTENFASTVAAARRDDFVYFDPPYVPLSATSSFTGYQAGGFGPEQQKHLRDVARQLVSRGVHVLLSNSSAPLVRELYAGEWFTIHEVSATRALNCKAEKRGAVKELLITAGPKGSAAP